MCVCIYRTNVIFSPKLGQITRKIFWAKNWDCHQTDENFSLALPKAVHQFSPTKIDWKIKRHWRSLVMSEAKIDVFKDKKLIFALKHLFPESGSRKRFHNSRMRAIDSPHKIRGNRVIFTKKFFYWENRKFFDFRVNTPTPFPESESRKRFYVLNARNRFPA